MGKHTEMSVEEWRVLAGLDDPYALNEAAPGGMSWSERGRIGRRQQKKKDARADAKQARDDKRTGARAKAQGSEIDRTDYKRAPRTQKGVTSKGVLDKEQIKQRMRKANPPGQDALASKSRARKVSDVKAALKRLKKAGDDPKKNKQLAKKAVARETGLGTSKPKLPESIGKLWAAFLGESGLTPSQVESVMDEAIVTEDQDTMDAILDLDEQFSVWLEGGFDGTSRKRI